MALIRSKDSKFERAVRSQLHAAGFRYRLHVGALAGKPDLVFPSRGKVVFLHSCFWHGHGCKRSRMPKTNRDYWSTKIETNRERDLKNERILRRAGWGVLNVWECRFRAAPQRTLARIFRFLGGPRRKERT